MKKETLNFQLVKAGSMVGKNKDYAIHTILLSFFITSFSITIDKIN